MLSVPESLLAVPLKAGMNYQHMQGREINPPNEIHIVSFLVSILHPVHGLHVLRKMSRPGDGPEKGNKNDKRTEKEGPRKCE